MSKIQVIECENGKKRFIDSLDENNYRASFARIEQLRPESNYYLLWREEGGEINSQISLKFDPISLMSPIRLFTPIPSQLVASPALVERKNKKRAAQLE